MKQYKKVFSTLTGFADAEEERVNREYYTKKRHKTQKSSMIIFGKKVYFTKEEMNEFNKKFC